MLFLAICIPRSTAATPSRCRRVRLILAATLATLAAGAASGGAELRVDSSSIDAGGGSASGGSFQLSGTIAQIDADPLQPASGGNFQLTGGFLVIGNQAASDALFKDSFEGL